MHKQIPHYADVAQWLVPLLPKQKIRVRFPPSAPVARRPLIRSQLTESVFLCLHYQKIYLVIQSQENIGARNNSPLYFRPIMLCRRGRQFCCAKPHYWTMCCGYGMFVIKKTFLSQLKKNCFSAGNSLLREVQPIMLCRLCRLFLFADYSQPVSAKKREKAIIDFLQFLQN